jgi:hypothetical protein
MITINCTQNEKLAKPFHLSNKIVFLFPLQFSIVYNDNNLLFPD